MAVFARDDLDAAEALPTTRSVSRNTKKGRSGGGYKGITRHPAKHVKGEDIHRINNTYNNTIPKTQ